ncbi:MAG: hypothetical protein ACE5IJ_08155 [Thermoplasmata archaeon]
MPIPFRELVHRVRSFRVNKPPAFILGIGSNGLSFVRSLGGRRIPVVALDTWKDPGMYSRYCLASVVPSAEEDEVGLLNRLAELGESASTRGTLIPTADSFALFVSKYRAKLSKHYYLNIAEYDGMLTVMDRRLQYEYARTQGLETPRTLFPSDLAIEDIAREMDYPCIIKPSYSHLWWTYGGNRWGKLAEARSAEELIDVYSEMKKSGLDFMVQEEIAGEDDQLYGLNTYLDRASKPKAIFTKRKLRQYPRYFGSGSIFVGVWIPEVAELGLKLLRGLKFRGNAHVEFKRDPRDGALKLMEMNARSSAATHHAVVSGVDIPHITYQDSIGQGVEEGLTFREGVRWIDLAKDLGSFRAYHRAGDIDLGLWLRSLRGERCFAFFAWDDPSPAWLGLWEAARAEFGRAR